MGKTAKMINIYKSYEGNGCRKYYRGPCNEIFSSSTFQATKLKDERATDR